MSVRRLAALLATIDSLSFDAKPYAADALDHYARDLEATRPKAWARYLRAASRQARALAG